MGLASILLAVASFLFIGLGFVTTPIPLVGTLFSFMAPTAALAGVIVGGVGMSRAKRSGQPADMATAGVVLSALALIPALLVALTCGLCNAACSTGETTTNRSFNMRLGQPPALRDAGPSRAVPPPPGRPSLPVAPAPQGAPPPAFPPPPVPEPGTR